MRYALVLMLLGVTLEVMASTETPTPTPVVTREDLHNPYVVAMPQQCDDLLPDDERFTDFLRQAVRVLAVKDHPTAVKALEILTYRDELQNEVNWQQDGINQADTFLRAYLCHFFPKEERSSITSGSPTVKEFITKHHKELVDRIRGQIIKIRSAREEMLKLKKEIVAMDKEFTSLRETVQADVRAKLEKELAPSSKNDKKPK